MFIFSFNKVGTINYTNLKILSLVLLLLLSNCETTENSNRTFNQPESVRNPKCENVQKFKVFQVLNNFVLANVCKDVSSDFCMGHVVYFEKEKDIIYYDDQIIEVKQNECAIYIGTYRYQTGAGGYKTVPVVKIIDSRMPATKVK